MSTRFLLGVLFLMPGMALAAPKGGAVQRGGLGFLYPDANSFSNPGQLVTHRGVRAEASYARQVNTQLTGSNQTASSSVAFGNSMFGIGGFASRSTENVLNEAAGSSDFVGGGIGVGLAKEKLTIGLGYSRSIDTVQTNDGTATATMTLNTPKVRIGFGGSTTLLADNRDVQTATAGLGFALGRFFRAEFIGKLQDFSDTSNLTGSFFLTASGSHVYMGSGYTWNHLASEHQIQGRLGFVIGRSIDLSAFVDHTFNPVNNPKFGGSVRVAF